MSEKVILISIDGMRPDGALQCGHPFVQKLISISSYTLTGQSVLPTVTLPCHMSMFHSVPPQRHGILSNDYVPPVRPVPGIAEQLAAAGKVCAAFYNWEPNRNLWKSGSMKYTSYIESYQEENTDLLLTRQAVRMLEDRKPDFIFLYLVETDDKGGHGRSHGEDCPEDFTIPMFFYGSSFEPGKKLETASLLDLAPTIAKLTGVSPAREWEGRVIEGI